MEEPEFDAQEEALNGVAFYTDMDNPTRVYVEYKLYNGAWCFEPLGSERFEAYLGYTYRDLTGYQELADFKELIEIRRQNAIYMGDNAVHIDRRVTGTLGGKIHYYLADKKGQTVVISQDGWKTFRRTGKKFIRAPSDAPQVTPVTGGEYLSLLRPYINLNDDDFKLFAI